MGALRRDAVLALIPHQFKETLSVKDPLKPYYLSGSKGRTNPQPYYLICDRTHLFAMTVMPGATTGTAAAIFTRLCALLLYLKARVFYVFALDPHSQINKVIRWIILMHLLLR